MSPCWDSSRVVTRATRVLRRAGPARLAGLALALLLAAGPRAGDARTRSGGDPDTGVVTRVRVSSEGVEVTRGGSTSTRAAESGSRARHPGGRVNIGGSGIHISVDQPDSQAGSIDINVPHVHVNGPAVTVDGEPSGLVRVFADVHVPPGTRIDGDVVAVFGSATVEGHVTGSVVAVFGSVRLLPGASVEQDAVAVGGVLDQAPGTIVKGETVSVGFLPISFGAPTLGVLLLTIVTGWLLALFMAWLLSLLFRERMLRIATTASRQSGASFFIGLLSAPMVVIAMLLLLVTVIGVPVALLLPVAYALMVWSGQLAATRLLGSKLMGRRAGEGSVLAPIAAGSAFVALFFIAGAVLSGPPGVVRTFALFFALIGVLLVTGLSILGTGALIVSRFGSRSRESSALPAAIPAQPPLAPAPPASA
jgi:hypothetical protein